MFVHNCILSDFTCQLSLQPKPDLKWGEWRRKGNYNCPTDIVAKDNWNGCVLPSVGLNTLCPCFQLPATVLAPETGNVKIFQPMIMFTFSMNALGRKLRQTTFVPEDLKRDAVPLLPVMSEAKPPTSRNGAKNRKPGPGNPVSPERTHTHLCFSIYEN